MLKDIDSVHLVKKLLTKYSIRALARKVDVSDTTIQYWKKGMWRPNDKNLKKLLKLERLG